MSHSAQTHLSRSTGSCCVVCLRWYLIWSRDDAFYDTFNLGPKRPNGSHGRLTRHDFPLWLPEDALRGGGASSLIAHHSLFPSIRWTVAKRRRTPESRATRKMRRDRRWKRLPPDWPIFGDERRAKTTEAAIIDLAAAPCTCRRLRCCHCTPAPHSSPSVVNITLSCSRTHTLQDVLVRAAAVWQALPAAVETQLLCHLESRHDHQSVGSSESKGGFADDWK